MEVAGVEVHGMFVGYSREQNLAGYFMLVRLIGILVMLFARETPLWFQLDSTRETH